jgi:hypothetical protein
MACSAIAQPGSTALGRDAEEAVEQVAVNGDRTHCVPGIVNLRFA